MSDLAPGQPKGGPATPTKQADPPLPLPSAPAAQAGDDLTLLTPADLQERIAARERDMKFRIHAIKHEVRSLGSDVQVEGRPLLDWIRDRKEAALGGAAAVGLVAGVVLGLIARHRSLPDEDDTGDVVRFRMESLLEDAAQRVARGEDVETATARAVRSAPVVYADRSVTVAAKSSVAQALDLGLKSLIGVVAKSVGDQITRSLTGQAVPPPTR